MHKRYVLKITQRLLSPGFHTDSNTDYDSLNLSHPPTIQDNLNFTTHQNGDISKTQKYIKSQLEFDNGSLCGGQRAEFAFFLDLSI